MDKFEAIVKAVEILDKRLEAMAQIKNMDANQAAITTSILSSINGVLLMLHCEEKESASLPKGR